MKCLHCGTELSDQDSFCNECGTKVSKDVCECGAVKPSADALYCTNCGKLFISFTEKEIEALESYLRDLRESRTSYKQLEEIKNCKKSFVTCKKHRRGLKRIVINLRKGMQVFSKNLDSRVFLALSERGWIS